MFVEPDLSSRRHRGWVEVVCGSMFSGKTEELIRRLKRALLAQQKVEIFKPKIDVRYSEKKVVSHNETAIHSTPVSFSNDILLRAVSCDVVGIDEVQFFDDEIVDVVNKLANDGKRVIVAGLDMDYLGRPFSPMDDLLAVAEYVTKVHAICMQCGSIASYTHRRIKGDKQVMIGEKDIYEALCRSCFFDANQPGQ